MTRDEYEQIINLIKEFGDASWQHDLEQTAVTFAQLLDLIPWVAPE